MWAASHDFNGSTCTMDLHIALIMVIIHLRTLLEGHVLDKALSMTLKATLLGSLNIQESAKGHPLVNDGPLNFVGDFV